MSDKLKENKPLLIVTAGLIGGLGAWVWAKTVGPSPLLADPLLAIPSYMFLGAIAGVLGVYLIAKTDPAQTAHAIAFSLACGIFWGPVISGAEALVNRAKVEQASREVSTQQVALLRVQDEISQRSQSLQAQIENAADRAQELEQVKRQLVTLSASQGNQAIGHRLEQIDTATIRADLATSSASVRRLNGELEGIDLAPIRPSTHDDSP